MGKSLFIFSTQIEHIFDFNINYEYKGGNIMSYINFDEAKKMSDEEIDLALTEKDRRIIDKEMRVTREKYDKGILFSNQEYLVLDKKSERLLFIALEKMTKKHEC